MSLPSLFTHSFQAISSFTFAAWSPALRVSLSSDLAVAALLPCPPLEAPFLRRSTADWVEAKKLAMRDSPCKTPTNELTDSVQETQVGFLQLNRVRKYGQLA